MIHAYCSVGMTLLACVEIQSTCRLERGTIVKGFLAARYCVNELPGDERDERCISNELDDGTQREQMKVVGFLGLMRFLMHGDVSEQKGDKQFQKGTFDRL